MPAPRDLGVRRTPLYRTDKAQAAIVRTFKQLGCTVTNCTQGHLGAGHPDLIIQYKGRAAAVEVKTKGSSHRLTPEQVDWAVAAQARGNLWFVATTVEDATAIWQHLATPERAAPPALPEPYQTQFEALKRAKPYR